MSNQNGDRRKSSSSHARDDRSVRLSLKLAKQTVEQTKRTIEEARKLLDRPVYPYHRKRDLK